MEKMKAICSVCKKTRNEKLEWVEDVNPDDQTFPITHGYCHDCFAEEIRKMGKDEAYIETLITSMKEEERKKFNMTG